MDALTAHLFHVLAGFALAAALIVSGLLYGPSAEPGKIDETSSGAIVAYLLAATLLVIGSFHDAAALAIFTLLTAATVTIAWRTEAVLWALPAAGLMAVLVMLHWCAPAVFEQLVLPAGVTRGAIPDPPTGTGLHLLLGAAFAGLFGLSGYAAQGRSENPRVSLLWSATAVVTPLAILMHGRAVFEGLPQFRHYNPIGTVHGGFAATLLDSALGCAVFSTLVKGDTWTTLELKFNLVRPMTKDTGPVRAEGRIIHRGRTVATSEGDVKDRAGKLYAHATTTTMIFPAKG